MVQVPLAPVQTLMTTNGLLLEIQGLYYRFNLTLRNPDRRDAALRLQGDLDKALAKWREVTGKEFTMSQV